jgi:hypothetical protein
MPRQTSTYQGTGSFDRSALPTGILPTTVTAVSVLIGEANYPDRRKGKNIDAIISFSLLPQGHKYEIEAEFDIRIAYGEDKTLIVDDVFGSKLDERCNIKTLHDFLTAIGYTGGFDPTGAWVDPDDNQVPFEDIQFELANYVAKLPAENILANVVKDEATDGKIWFNVSNWYFQANTPDGMKNMRRKFAKGKKAAQANAPMAGGSQQVASSNKPGRRQL